MPKAAPGSPASTPPAAAPAAADGVASASSTTPKLTPIHDLTHQVGLVREALRSEKRRLGFFLGAGCPLGIYDEGGGTSIKHIPDVAGLTAAIQSALAGENDLLECWSKLTTACKSSTCPVPNVEHILTQLRTICALKGAATVDGMTVKNLRDLDARICGLIVSLVGKSLPGHKNAYHRLAAWVAKLERTYPLEIFTPNYDLLLEESFEQFKVPFFDGFVGSREPFFDLAAMEQDAVPTRWTRLWKLHGSINWIMRSDDTVFRCHPAKSGQQVLIYPSHLKYDQSRRMPYLAMCDRLKAFFRETNPVIFLCGYSFADEHLNEVLLDGLRGNRSAHCFALLFSGLDGYKDAVRYAAKHSNLTLLAWDGAVVAGRHGSFQEIDRALVRDGSGVTVVKGAPDAGGNDTWHPRCNLGDFHHFTLFMETQFGARTFD
jgi:hypothetical protein